MWPTGRTRSEESDLDDSEDDFELDDFGFPESSRRNRRHGCKPGRRASFGARRARAAS